MRAESGTSGRRLEAFSHANRQREEVEEEEGGRSRAAGLLTKHGVSETKRQEELRGGGKKHGELDGDNLNSFLQGSTLAQFPPTRRRAARSNPVSPPARPPPPLGLQTSRRG